MPSHVPFIDNDISESNRVKADWLNGVNDFVYTDVPGPRGSNFVGYTMSGTGMRDQTVEERLQKYMLVTDADDVDPTGVLDSTAGVLAAVAQAQALGKVLLWPAGTYKMTSLDLTGTLLWEGEDSENTFLVFTATPFGLKSTLSAANHRVSLIDFCVNTTGTSGYGIDIDYTLTGFADREELRVYTSGLEFRGSNPKTQGWTAGFRMKDCQGTYHEGLWMNGIASGGSSNISEATNTISPFGVLITGNEYPTDHVFEKARFWSYDQAVFVDGATEGITWDNVQTVNCGEALFWSPTAPLGGRPGLQIMGGHTSTYKKGIRAENIQQVFIEGHLFYHNQGATSDWYGVHLTQVIDFEISANFHRYAPAAQTNTSTGAYVAGADSGGIFYVCNFGGYYSSVIPLDVGLEIANTVSTGRVFVADTCYFTGFYRNRDILLGGINDQIYGERNLMVYQTVGQTIPSGVRTPMTFDTKLADPMQVWAPGDPEFQTPANKGIRKIRGVLNSYIAANATGVRTIYMMLNGADLIVVPMPAITVGAPTSVTVVFEVAVSSNDIISFDYFQDSGVDLQCASGGGTRLTYTYVL